MVMRGTGLLPPSLFSRNHHLFDDIHLRRSPRCCAITRMSPIASSHCGIKKRYGVSVCAVASSSGNLGQFGGGTSSIGNIARHQATIRRKETAGGLHRSAMRAALAPCSTSTCCADRPRRCRCGLPMRSCVSSLDYRPAATSTGTAHAAPETMCVRRGREHS